MLNSFQNQPRGVVNYLSLFSKIFFHFSRLSNYPPPLPYPTLARGPLWLQAGVDRNTWQGLFRSHKKSIRKVILRQGLIKNCLMVGLKIGEVEPRTPATHPPLTPPPSSLLHNTLENPPPRSYLPSFGPHHSLSYWVIKFYSLYTHQFESRPSRAFYFKFLPGRGGERL